MLKVFIEFCLNSLNSMNFFFCFFYPKSIPSFIFFFLNKSFKIRSFSIACNRFKVLCVESSCKMNLKVLVIQATEHNIHNRPSFIHIFSMTTKHNLCNRPQLIQYLFFYFTVKTDTPKYKVPTTKSL